MAEILIKGLVLPKEGHIEAHIWCNGTVTYKKKIDNQWDRNSTTAVALPSHGRLIDEAELRERAYAIQRRDRISFTDALAMALIEAETIVEATE